MKIIHLNLIRKSGDLLFLEIKNVIACMQTHAIKPKINIFIISIYLLLYPSYFITYLLNLKGDNNLNLVEKYSSLILFRK